MSSNSSALSFDNTEVAFKSKSKAELKKASVLFKSFDYPLTLKWGPTMAKIAIALGFKFMIKSTIFKQFCGGETIEECDNAINLLAESGIGTILDYSVEGAEDEETFDNTTREIIETIKKASNNEKIPFSVFKVTGIVESEILEKVSKGEVLSEDANKKWEKAQNRFYKICDAAFSNKVRLFIDAEESWLQDAIDGLAENAMRKYNTSDTIIYNTLQMYRHDRIDYLTKQIESTTHFLGFKLVRGAYMEKERSRALAHGYLDPIQKDKQSTDADYDKAVSMCLDHHNRVSICIGTHNEHSSLLATRIIADKGLPNSTQKVYFSQLLGMSDHISFNLSHHRFNVAKYVPYGPVAAVIPYLTRRAQENSGMAGQMGRELSLITKELNRRKG